MPSRLELLNNKQLVQRLYRGHKSKSLKQILAALNLMPRHETNYKHTFSDDCCAIHDGASIFIFHFIYLFPA